MIPEEISLIDRVAVVTGGSRGIGRATSKLLARLGANVVVNYVNDASAADETVRSIEATGGHATAIKADVSKVVEAQRLIDETLNRFKRLDILICNAGVWQGAPVDQLTEELWDRTMDINLKGVWSVCRAAVPIFKQQASGKVVIISSTAGQRGEANYSNYAASKGALIAFTKSLADELGNYRINVNCVAPGWVDTDMTNADLAEDVQRKKILATIPLGAIAASEEIAGPIAFLCTSWASHITGEILNVNGGSVLCG